MDLEGRKVPFPLTLLYCLVNQVALEFPVTLGYQGDPAFQEAASIWDTFGVHFSHSNRSVLYLL